MARATKKQRDDAFKALNDYSKRGALDDIDALSKSLSGESDRGMVVIIGSLMEDLLLEEIIKRLPPIPADQLNILTRNGGVLGGWNERMKLARALGIINDSLADVLEVVAKMRNACAHSRQPIDFGTPELVQMLPLLMWRGGEIAQEVNQPRHTRQTFLIVAAQIWGIIKAEDHSTFQKRLFRLLQIPDNL